MPRVYQPTRRERHAHFRQQYAAFLVAGLLGLALFTGARALSQWRTGTMRRDTADHPLLSGQATIIQIFEGRGSTPFGPYTVELRLHGQSVWTHAAVPFFPGQRVTLHCRVGRSGLLYPINAGL